MKGLTDSVNDVADDEKKKRKSWSQAYQEAKLARARWRGARLAAEQKASARRARH